MYAPTSLKGAKMCKIGKKGVFLVILTNFGKDMMDKLRKLHPKMKDRPRGATRMSRGYQARPKIHIIRVVFQD